MSSQDIAAHNLEGRVLSSGWTVVKKIEKEAGSTGGFFSVCYTVRKDDEIAFLKALNFNSFFQQLPGRSIVQILQEQTNAFEFEKNLLLKCKNHNLTKVSMILGEGEEILEGFAIPNVPYLIFEVAEGDIRSNIKFNNNLDLVWKIKSLHDIAVGLEQLNKLEISHQDLKPSNVLLYNDSNISKIGDLGRSLCSSIPAPHDDGSSFTGQLNYSPPEYLYKYIEPNWLKRVRLTDMYLFGSLITYYFIGINMTALLSKHLDPNFRWNNYEGNFDTVKDYLLHAFTKSITEIRTGLRSKSFADDLIEIIEYCSNPIPENRGHKRSLAEAGNKYSYKRIISKLDLIKKRAELNLYKNDEHI